MLILSVLASLTAAAAAEAEVCAAGAAIQAPEALALRGHSYALIGACGGMPEVYMFYGNEYFSSLLISSYIDHFSSDDVEEEDNWNIGLMFSINLMEDVSMPVFYNYSSLDVQNVTSQHTIGFNIVYTLY